MLPILRPRSRLLARAVVANPYDLIIFSSCPKRLSNLAVFQIAICKVLLSDTRMDLSST